MSEENVLEQIEVLKKIQAIDSQIQEIEKAMADLPARVEKLAAEREKERGEINAAKGQTDQLNAERDRLDREIQFDRETFQKFESKIKEVTSNDAYQAALKELEIRKKNIRGKEEEQLRIMEEIETVNKKVAQLEEAFEEVASKFEEQENELNARAAEVKEKSAGLRAEREELAQSVDRSLFSRYEMILKKRDGIGIVPVVSEVCQGCLMSVPPQVVNDARAGNRGVQNCSHCHRVIYWAPSVSAT